jgi:hypothetical protein
MDSRATRTPWTRPELIVLVRGKPEEKVLSVCKTDTSGDTRTANNDNVNCHYAGGACTECAWFAYS